MANGQSTLHRSGYFGLSSADRHPESAIHEEWWWLHSTHIPIIVTINEKSSYVVRRDAIQFDRGDGASQSLTDQLCVGRPSIHFSC